MPWLLAALFAAALVFYTDDYVIAGVLPEIARDMQVSRAAAGQLITVFAVTVAVAAPVAAVVLARVPRRALLAISLCAFAFANAAAAFTPSFPVLMALRMVAAGAAATATPALFATAVQQAPAGKIGRHVAVVSLGVTGSIAAGVPAGTWLGGLLGWRAVFAMMALCALGALAWLALTLPRQRTAGDAPDWRAQISSLRQRAVGLGLLANTSLMTGTMMLLTYLAPFLADTAAADVDARALSFGLAGIAGTIGMWGGGTMTDRWGPARTLLVGTAAIAAAMICLCLMWMLRPVPMAAVLPVLALWGAAAFWNSPAIQARLATLSGPLAPQALALNTSGTYLGVSLGGLLGGFALSRGGSGALPPIALAFVLATLVLLSAANRSTTPPALVPESGGDVALPENSAPVADGRSR